MLETEPFQEVQRHGDPTPAAAQDPPGGAAQAVVAQAALPAGVLVVPALTCRQHEATDMSARTSACIHRRRSEKQSLQVQ